MNIKRLVPVLAVLGLSGCGWVDSTGKQEGSTQANVDPTLVVVDENSSFSINENTQRTIVFNSPDNRVANWSWQVLEGQGNIDQCVIYNGFDRTIASNSLSQTCADPNNCTLDVEEQVVDGVTSFHITTPELRAPAALQLRFMTVAPSGIQLEKRQTLCGISINEAPAAMDDGLVATRGETLQVSGNDSASLLANDTDDVDVRNEPLRIDPTPVRAPRFAERFTLFADGGFIYKPSLGAPISNNGSVSDSFTYSVTDGTHVSQATALIKISEFNSAPVLISDIDRIDVDLFNNSSDPVHLRLTDYFSDAEDDLLSFSVLDDSLPESGTLRMGVSGVLQGIPAEISSGLHLVSVAASDSMLSTNVEFLLAIVRNGVRNTPPSVTDISNETVRGDFSYDVAQFFSDRDGDQLYYTADQLPDGVTISAKGVIEGSSTANNRGNWLIRVYVDDGNGGETDDGFRLRIR